MASIWKHPKSRFWYARFALADGAYTNRSTKKTDRTEAKRVAQTYEDVARRRISESQIRRTVHDLFEKVNGQKLETATTEDYLARWLQRKEVENAARTVVKYRSVVNEFSEWLGARSKRDISEVTSGEISTFRDVIASRVRAATVNVYLKTLRTAFQGAWRDGLISENPASKVSTIKKRGDSFERRPFTLKELKDILAVANGEWHSMIVIGLYTGARMTDISRLTWENIDLQKREIRFVTQKTGRRQSLPMAKPLERELQTLPVNDDPKAALFPHASKKTASRLSKDFYDILISAGLAVKRPHDGHGQGRNTKRDYSEVSFHSLRHTATSLLKNAGVSDVIAREIIGHDTVAASRVYTHIDSQALRGAVNQLPNLVISKKRSTSHEKKP